MPDEIENKKSAVIEAIKRNIKVLNSIVLLVVFTILFVSVRFLFTMLNYVPAFSVVTMLLVVSGLVFLSLYLSRVISRKAIKELEGYSDKLNVLLISLQQEINERKLAEVNLEKAYSELEDQIKGRTDE